MAAREIEQKSVKSYALYRGRLLPRSEVLQKELDASEKLAPALTEPVVEAKKPTAAEKKAAKAAEKKAAEEAELERLIAEEEAAKTSAASDYQIEE